MLTTKSHLYKQTKKQNAGLPSKLAIPHPTSTTPTFKVMFMHSQRVLQLIYTTSCQHRFLFTNTFIDTNKS